MRRPRKRWGCRRKRKEEEQDEDEDLKERVFGRKERGRLEGKNNKNRRRHRQEERERIEIKRKDQEWKDTKGDDKTNFSIIHSLFHLFFSLRVFLSPCFSCRLWVFSSQESLERKGRWDTKTNDTVSSFLSMKQVSRSDGSKVHLKYVDLKSQGVYRCEVCIISDPKALT